jgi:Na+/H+ antiporter NhaA
MAAIGLVVGTGFAASLFFSKMASSQKTLGADAKLGILPASLIAGVPGCPALRLHSQERHAPTPL